MSVAVFAIVLLGAMLHAGWNAIVKGAGDTRLTTVLVISTSALIAAGTLPFLPQPAPESWPFLATTMVLQIVYFALVASAYAAADMSQIYPLMRGLAPLLVAVVGTMLLGENPGPVGWVGIGLVCSGVLSLALRGRAAGNGRGIALALTNAAVIASYTLVDGAGARLSGAPLSYTLWLNVLAGIPFLSWALLSQRAALIAHVRRHWHLGIVGAVANIASYGLALWAMTQAPIAIVAALRETSILFGTVIAVLVLREKVDGMRIIATGIIAAGAIVLRLA
ncbi:MAG TPA: EamA family transporter [Alphaproteobacteria bacterium]|nr:EamA family transporter [Alphaproteobacteria bacterium]